MHTKTVPLSWSRPGRAWELEALVLFFAALTLMAPLLAAHQAVTGAAPAEVFRAPLAVNWTERNEFIWLSIVVAVCLAHFLAANLTVEHVSTPFTHLITPIFLSGLAYVRLWLLHRGQPGSIPLVRGTWLEALVYFGVVVALTFLLAHLRARRHLRRLTSIGWEVVERPHRDPSFLAQAVVRIRPLFYLPRVYRAAPEGLLVEGWSYALFVPFSEITAVGSLAHGDLGSSGYYFAASSHGLVRIDTHDLAAPLFISPRHAYGFLQYLEKQVYGHAEVDPWKELEEADEGA